MNALNTCTMEPVNRYAVKFEPVATISLARYVSRKRDYVDAFYQAYNAWRRETDHLSLIVEKVKSPHFRSIVSMREVAVPLILYELRRHPSFIFFALQEITGQNPIPKSARGNVRSMVEAWLLWAEREDVNAL